MNSNFIRLIVLTILAGSALYIFLHEDSSVGTVVTKKQPLAINSSTLRIPVSLSKEGISQERAAAAAANARAMTPRLIEFTVDRLMDTRKDEYDLFFRSWKISSETADHSLLHIRDSEIELKYAIKQFYLDGGNNRREFVETVNMIKSSLALNLKSVLGDEIGSALIKLRVEMDDQLADKGLQIVEKKEREKIAR